MVLLGPDSVGLLVARLQQDAGLGSASGKLLRAEPPDIIDSAGHVMYRNVWPTNRGEDEPDGPAFDLPGEVFGVCAAAGLYRCTMLDDIRINGEILDASFFAYLEDVDIDWRARSRGWRSWYEPAAVATHARSGSGAWGSAKLQRHILKNRLLLIVKNDGGLGMLARLPGMVAFTGAKAVQLLVTRPAALPPARGRPLLLLNPDTEVAAGSVAKLEQALDTLPNAVGAGPKIVRPDGRLDLASRRTFPSPGVALARLVGLSRLFPRSRTLARYKPTYGDPDQPGEIDAGTAAAMCVGR